MADLDFKADDVLEQARGNHSAMWALGTRWARERDGSVDAWALFVGKALAPSWDEMGDHASARDVAVGAALNMASTGDIRPVELTGDDERADLLLEGPDQASLDEFAVSRDDVDRTNELVFRAIAERRGMTVESRRDDRGLHLVFARV